MSLSMAVMQLAYGIPRHPHCFASVTPKLSQLGDHFPILAMHSLKDISKNRVYKPA
jgi:hypothetical protein